LGYGDRRFAAGLVAGGRAVVVRGVLHRVRGEGADVSVPYVVAGRARRSTHGRLRDPGRLDAEDGNVRVYPAGDAVVSGGGARSDYTRRHLGARRGRDHLRRVGRVGTTRL